MFYISQLNESDCGFASLKMLLANLYNNNDYLFLKQDEDHGPYSYLDLINIAKKYGVILEGYRFSNKEEFNTWVEFPIIASFTKGEYLHSCLILKRKGNKLLLLDPNSRPRWISIKEFIKTWNGTLLKVKEKEDKESAKPNVINFEKRIRYGFTSQIIQVFLSFSFLAFLLFLDKEFSIYISLGFIGLYFILEIIFRRVLLKIMDSIDNISMDNLTVKPKNGYLFLTRLSDFKKVFISGKVSLISNIIIGFSLIFLIIFNGPWNAVIVFTIILLSLIEIFLIQPIFLKRERQIAEEEKRLNKSRSLVEFKRTFYEIKRKSQTYTYTNAFKSIIIYSLILLIIYAVLFATSTITPVSLLFYFMISVYLKKSIDFIFQFQDQQRIKNVLMAKLNNLY